jgi:hypothetical protein
MTKKSILSAIGGGAIYLVFGLFNPGTSHAGVNVDIHIPLPGLVIPAPPALIVIPGTYVYYPPDVDVDIFFYHGYWYRPYRGGWYIADGYNGPWRTIGPRRVPRALIGLPPTYRRIPPGYERMPHDMVQRNWRTWEKERHWDKHRGERGGHGRGRGHGMGRNKGD